MALRLGAVAGADGIAANIEFPPVGRLVEQALASTPRGASIEHWSEKHLLWPVLAAIDRSLDEDWMKVVRRFVRGDGPEPIEGRRMEAALRIAGLFASYDRERPDLVRAWGRGQDIGADGEALDEVWAWQPPLWRLVRQGTASPSPGECLNEAIACIAAGELTRPLPARVCVYGLTALSEGHLRVLGALGGCSDVHLFLLHPSPALWDSVAAEVAVPKGLPPPRSADPSFALAANPLLSSWGRDAREVQVVLAACGAPPGAVHPGPPAGPRSLLQRLQADVRLNRGPPGPPGRGQADPRPCLAPGDRSVQIHACHGPARQVEVLRDAVLHLLNDDPTLEPRDLLVMCPDVEAYAPLLEAAFQPDRLPEATSRAPSGIPAVRLRIADRSPVASNPLAGLVVALLSLARSRVTAGAVFDFASLGPVHRRFDLDDDQLGTMAELVDDAQISWGIDGSHRAEHGLPGREERTWHEGISRALAGAMLEDRAVGVVGNVLPLAGVEGDQVDAAGRLAEIVSRVTAVAEEMRLPLPAADWRRLLADAVRRLGSVARGDDWQWGALEGQLDRLFAGAPHEGLALSLPEVALLASPLAEGGPSRADHRTGDLTVCGLVPMRSVPHRVICLLGMDDGAFPRSLGDDGDDALATAPRVGSRDRNGEDRQSLLDALMAAREHLVITFTGRDPSTNADCPPAVPIAELIDVIDATVRSSSPEKTTARRRWVHDHPLQPFDPRNFQPGIPPFRCFDQRMLAASQVVRSAPGQRPRPISPLPALPPGTLDLSRLQRFLEHPVRAFVETRLGFRYPDQPKPRDDTLPVELGALQEWEVGQRLLDGALAGHPREDLLLAEWGRGTLPPGNLGRRLLPGIEATADGILAAVAGLGLALPADDSRQIELSLSGGWQLMGSVGGLTGHTAAVVQYSRVRPRHVAAAYLRLAALAAAYPDDAWRAVLVGRHPKPDEVIYKEVLGPIDPGTAVARLGELVALYAEGMRAPLPLTMATSYEYMTARDAAQGLARASSVWEESWGRPAEASDPHHVLAFGGVVSFAELLARPPLRGERPAGRLVGSRFEVLAHLLWTPILETCRSWQ